MYRPHLRIGLLTLCTAVAGYLPHLTPRIGKCGSALSFTFQVLPGVLLESLDMRIPHYFGVALVMAMVFSATAFFVPAIIWYRKAPREWFLAGLAGWFALFAAAYFFYLPVPDCP